MQIGSQYSFRALTNGDKIGAMKLLNDTFNMSYEFWKWKYELYPHFDQSLVMVALNANHVVGVAHWIPRNIKISDSIAVKATLGADLAVHAQHKGQGIGKKLISFENRILENKEIIISYGFIEPELVKHIHSPQIGLVAVPTSTTVYRKYLNCSKIQEKTSLLNRIANSDEKMREKLAKLNERVLFRLEGMPPFLMKLGPDKIEVEENDLTDPDLKIECDSTFLASIVTSQRRTLKLIKSLLLRKIKIKPVKAGSILKIYSTLKLTQSLFASR